jgi:hypothetical protein
MIPSHSLVDAAQPLRSQSSFAGASVYSVLVLATRAAALDTRPSPRVQLSMFVRVLSPFRDRGAGNVVEVLIDSLAPKAKVKRSGSWSEIESVDLVAGYMVCTFTPFPPCPSAVPPLPCSSLIVLATHLSLR